MAATPPTLPRTAPALCRRRQQEQQFAGGVRGGGRADHLGYYSVLGLEGARAKGHVTQEDIKRAFRRAALRWHPDKQARGGAAAEAEQEGGA